MNYRYFRYTFLLIFFILLLDYMYENNEDFEVLNKLNFTDVSSLYLLYSLFLLITSIQSYAVIGDSSMTRISFTKTFILARFFSKLIPQSGNAYMAKTLKEEFNLNYSKYIERLLSLYIVDTFFVMSLFALTILLVGDIPLEYQFPQIGYITIIISLAGTGILIVYVTCIRKKIKWLNKLCQILFNIKKILKDYYLISKVFFYSILSFFVMSLIFYQIMLGLSLDVDWSIAVIFFTIFRVSNLVHITPGNIGLSEFMLGYLGDILGLGFSNGLLISLIYRVVVYSSLIFLGTVLGGWSLFKIGRK